MLVVFLKAAISSQVYSENFLSKGREMTEWSSLWRHQGSLHAKLTFTSTGILFEKIMQKVRQFAVIKQTTWKLSMLSHAFSSPQNHVSHSKNDFWNFSVFVKKVAYIYRGPRLKSRPKEEFTLDTEGWN